MPSIVEAYTQGGGDPVIPATSVQAYLIEYQTFTSHGHETVSDTAIPTTIARAPGVAILSWDKDSDDREKGLVHVPIHNPPGITSTWHLNSLYVKFVSEEGAVVEAISIYYDGDQKVFVPTKAGGSFHVDFNTSEAADYRYVRPKGISITLDLRFPNRKSVIKLYSVTLIYQAKN